MAGELRAADPNGANPKTLRRWPADDWRGPVLVVRLSSLGDVVLPTGVLRLLCERRPDLSIDFLTRRAYAPALEGFAGIDQLILEDAPDTTGGMSGSAARRDYQLILDWQGGQRGRRAASRFAPGARRVEAPRAALHRRMLVLFGRRIPAPSLYVVRLARSITGAAVNPDHLVPNVSVDSELQRSLQERLDQVGGLAPGWGVLAPGASRRMKAIPPDLTDALAAGLVSRMGGVVRLLPERHGARAEPEDPGSGTVHGHFQRLAANEMAFSGPLREVIALLSMARLLVGSDSGILHLATAMALPAIGLFGPTVPELGFSPLGRARPIGVDLDCRPCHVHGASRCWLGHQRCWKDMDPERILEAAVDLASR